MRLLLETHTHEAADAVGRGEGGVWGPFFGVLSFALLFVVMTTLGIKEPGKLVAQGLIILLAATLYGLRRANA